MWLLAVAVVAASVALSGCASSPGPAAEDDLETALRQRGLVLEELVIPYELTDEMRAWAHEMAPPSLTPERRLERLADRLLNEDFGSLEYAWGYTGTAVDVFERRQANCLSFTNLFVGMAREVGLEVSFLDVRDVATYRKEGDLVVISDHIAVGYELVEDTMVFDFSPYRNREVGEIHKLSDLTAIAMFYSNRGAEALQAGDVEGSLEWLRTAVVLDPELAHAWVNLGVGLRRAGDLQGAEDAYLKGLEADPEITSAYQNLTSMLHHQGRRDEAAEYAAALKKSPSKNPFTYLSLGDISRRNGRLEEARRFYRRAVLLGCTNAECYAAVGQLAAARGELRRARKMLKKAQERDSENPRVQRLADELAGR